jgi:hypothetical protein
MSSPFRNSMMLYTPSLSVWTGRKKDKTESAKANAAAGAVDGAANVYKALLPESPELLAVQKWATAFRSWVYATTLPWNDKGGRVARVERHMDFMTEAGDRIRAGEDLVEQFIASYARSIEEARFKLNGMFKQDDYPSEQELRRKFSFNIDCEAVPEATDFRIIDGLPPEEVERLVKDAQDGVEKRINAAMADAHERLVEVVVKMATTLEQFDRKEIKKFNDTLITNITDLCAVMPALNLTQDARIAEITRRAERLATYDLKDLRGIPETRTAAIAEARALAAFADNQPGFKAGQTVHALAVEPLAAAIEQAKSVQDVIADGAVFPQHGYETDAAPSSTEPPAISPASLADGW